MLSEYLKVCLLIMRARPVRSVLSLLGIYIGVLALVIILSIREGVRRQIEKQYKTSGAQVVFVHPGFDPAARQVGHLTSDDVERLRRGPGGPAVSSRVPRETGGARPGWGHRRRAPARWCRRFSPFPVPLSPA